MFLDADIDSHNLHVCMFNHCSHTVFHQWYIYMALCEWLYAVHLVFALCGVLYAIIGVENEMCIHVCTKRDLQCQ